MGKVLRSYELLEERMKDIYFDFYRETYREGTALDNKTKELIAIAASLSAGCQNCLEGHLKKAMKYGADGAEIREAVAIAVGVAAATIVDRSDLANFEMNFNELLKKATGAEKAGKTGKPGKKAEAEKAGKKA